MKKFISLILALTIANPAFAGSPMIWQTAGGVPVAHVLPSGGVQFPDNTVQTTAGGSGVFGIGSPVIGGTPLGVLFLDAGNTLRVDASRLHYDNVSHILTSSLPISQGAPPSLPSDLTTKSYVDSLTSTNIQWKNNVQAAYWGLAAMSGGFVYAADTINGPSPMNVDGHVVANGDRILFAFAPGAIGGGFNSKNFGIFICAVTATTTCTRDTDANTGALIQHAATSMFFGTANLGKTLYEQVNPITLDVTSQAWVDISTGAITAGNGLQLIANVVSVRPDISGTISATGSGTGVASNSLTNAQVNAGAAIAYTKMAALGSSIVPVTNASGFLTSSAVTAVNLSTLDTTISLTTQLAGKEPTITAGTVAQYWRGDKTWQSLNAAVLSEVLAGFVAGAGTVISTDTVLQAFQKLQGSITALPSYVFSTGLTNAAGTITSNISTGIPGGQTIKGGTNSADSLTLAANGAAAPNTFGNSLYIFHNTSSQGGGLGINQSYVAITPVYTQTSTAGGTDFLINRTETSIGTGKQYFFDFQIGGISVTNMDRFGNLSVKEIIGTGLAPTFSLAAGAGTGPTVSVTGNNISHTVNVTTGTTPAAGAIVRVNFTGGLTTNPRCVAHPNNAVTAALSGAQYVYTNTESVNNYQLSTGATALIAATAYSWKVHCIQ